MGVTRYLHTAIIVSDLEAAETFYSEMLELPKAERSLKFPGVWYQVGEYQIHLIEDQNWTAPEPNAQKWGRCPHLALAVDDLDLIKTRLTEKAILSKPVHRVALRCLLKTPMGILLN